MVTPFSLRRTEAVMRTPFVMSGSSPASLRTVQTAAFPLICASSTGRQKVMPPGVCR